MKSWNQVILLNLALTAVGLRGWLAPWPPPGKVALLEPRDRQLLERWRDLRRFATAPAPSDR